VDHRAFLFRYSGPPSSLYPPTPCKMSAGQNNVPQGASMDITNILNSKGAAAAAAAQGPDLAFHQQLMHHAANGANSETASERAGSPHGSEHSSRYSGPSMSHMGGMNGGMRYPSPTAMQGPLPMLQGFRTDSYDIGVPQQHDIPRSTGRDMSAGVMQQKAFLCSVCNKGFARRSDLARHGMLIHVLSSDSMLINFRTHSHWYQTACLRLSKL
jgi:hypothetical protein